MRLSIWSFTVTCAIMMAGMILVVGIVNIYVDGYGWMMLQMASSIYPGYDATSTFGSVLVGTGYALVDGAIGGLIFSFIYNLFVGNKSRRA
jgi:hypothetical protein